MSDSTTRTPVVVAVHPDDPMAMAVIDHFLNHGQNMDRRPRQFGPPNANGTVRYQGSIVRRTGDMIHSNTPVEVVITTQPGTLTRRDLVVRGVAPQGDRRYSPDAARLRNPAFAVNLGEHQVTGSQSFAVFAQRDGNRHSITCTNAANALAAILTDHNGWSNSFVSFPGGYNGGDWQRVNRWVDEGRAIELVSACCLNATKSRTGIIDRLAPEITDLLVRCAQAATSHLSPRISGWTISTFGPGDYDWLGELGISKVLLPYMWDGDETVVRRDLRRNYDLVSGLVEQLNTALPCPVRLAEINESSQGVDLPTIIAESCQRAVQMMPGMLARPPKIFETIEHDLRRRNPSLTGQALQAALQSEYYARIQQEAFLYLLDTARHGTSPDLPPDQPGKLCLGLEVHGGYIAQGSLNQQANRRLPIAWLPECVRQHWGDWVLDNHELRQARQRLQARLCTAGY